MNAREQAITLVSLPWDTLTHTSSGSDAKLNSAYGRNDGGQEGMEALLDYVSDIIGYRPDGYMLITLDAFVDVVNLMGGWSLMSPWICSMKTPPRTSIST